MRILFLKSGEIANRPGLALQTATDKLGHQTHRWKRTGPEEKHPREAAMQHGDTVAFRHGDVQGTGKVVGSGADGVTVRDESGREHQVRHEHLVGRHEPAEPHPDLGPDQKPLFEDSAVQGLPKKSVQPAKDEVGVYKLGSEGLSSLQEWLDKGKGIAIQAGAEHMTCSPEDADMSKPGAMLFIAPLKGKKRAAEKVAADYGGDWSKLVDVVRCSIACDTHEDVANMLAKLQASGMKLAQQPKDRFSKPLPAGYRDCLMNVTMPNGCIAEVQLHVKAMIAAKSEGHHYYEVQRTIDAKPREKWSSEDENAWQAAQDAQIKIYSGAWQKAVGGAGGDAGQEMRKAMSGAAAKWEFREREGAVFRRPAGKPGGVVDVFHEGKKAWVPYTGDRTAAYQQSDECGDPLAKGGPDGGGGEEPAEPLSKALMSGRILVLKAQIGGKQTRALSGDLFDEVVQVQGHTKGATYVAPYQSLRKKRHKPVLGRVGHYSHVIPSTHAMGGYHAVDEAGGVMHGDRPEGQAPRFATAEKAAAFGRSETAKIKAAAEANRRRIPDDTVDAVARAAHEHHKAWLRSYKTKPKGPFSAESKVHHWAGENKRKLSPDDVTAVTAAMERHAAEGAPKPAPKVIVRADAVEPQPAPKPVPDGIKRQIKAALDSLHDVRAGIEQGRAADVKFQGDGRYENDAHGNRLKQREAAEAALARIRAKGKELGADVESAIKELGGEPDLAPSGAARAYLAGSKSAHVNAPAPEPEGDWHTRTMARMKERTDDELRYIAKDASDAARTNPGGRKAGQYEDEAHYAFMELKKRDDARAPAPTPKPKPPGSNWIDKGDSEPEPHIKHFYVSAIDGDKRHLVAGPYASHDEAKARVDDVRAHAAQHQPGREAFMSWGTAGSEHPIKTPLGENWAKPAPSDPLLDAAKALMDEHKNMFDSKGDRTRLLGKVRALARKVEDGSPASMCLDILHTRLDMGKPLQFAGADKPAPRVVIRKPRST